MLGTGVRVGRSRLDVERIVDTDRLMDGLPTHVSVAYVEVLGSIHGQLMLVCPTATATAATQLLLPDPAELGVDRAQVRNEVLAEMGNIVLTTWINLLAERSGLDAQPSTPMVATDSTSAVMELPLARAVSDRDVVVRMDTAFTLEDASGVGSLRAPMHIVFLPAPGVLDSMLGQIVPDDAAPKRVPVRMGELVVSRRAGEVLAADALGSCVAVAILDRTARVAALAHVMLPEAPGSWRLHGRPTYAPRYADTAVPALLDAVERAGGARTRACAYLVGAGQMFSGTLAQVQDLPQRNLAAVRAALTVARIPVAHEDVGGTSSRSVELDVASLEVRVRLADATCGGPGGGYEPIHRRAA
jgi:chemotaxis protein CheD